MKLGNRQVRGSVPVQIGDRDVVWSNVTRAEPRARAMRPFCRSLESASSWLKVQCRLRSVGPKSNFRPARSFTRMKWNLLRSWKGLLPLQPIRRSRDGKEKHHDDPHTHGRRPREHLVSGMQRRRTVEAITNLI